MEIDKPKIEGGCDQVILENWVAQQVPVNIGWIGSQSPRVFVIYLESP